MMSELRQADADDAIFSEIMADHSKQDFEFWKNMKLKGHDVYMTAEQCAELGLVDKII